MIDAAGGREHSRAACFVITKSNHIRLIDSVEFDDRFDLVSVWRLLTDD